MISSHTFTAQRLKFVASVEMGQSPPSTEYSLLSNSGLPFLQGTADFGFQYPVPRVYCPVSSKVALAGDILFSVRAPVGTLNIADSEYGIGRGLCAIRCGEEIDRNFAWWMLHWARIQLAYEATGSTYEAVASEDVANLLIPLPSQSQQKQIANYLDRETEKIDALIAAKKRLLELLTEKRRSMITHAVTRGLRDDVPMKDSDVEWLGKIPEHWDALPLKLLCESLQTGPFGTQLHAEDYIENGVPSINPAHLSNGKIVPDLKVSVDEDTVERLAIHKFKLGDIVFARRGEIGRCGLVTQQEVGWLCGSGSLRARPHKNLLNPEYLVRVMLNTFASNWLSIMSVGTTMENLNTEIIGALAIPVPPLNEQNQICNKIEKQIISLDLLSEITKNTVSLLQERRTSLISAAVTGQLRIPD